MSKSKNKSIEEVMSRNICYVLSVNAVDVENTENNTPIEFGKMASWNVLSDFYRFMVRSLISKIEKENKLSIKDSNSYEEITAICYGLTERLVDKLKDTRNVAGIFQYEKFESSFSFHGVKFTVKIKDIEELSDYLHAELADSICKDY